MLRSGIAVVLASVAVLVGCGGGGSGGNPAPPPPPPPPANAVPTLSAQSFNGTEDAALTGQVAATDPGDTLAFATTSNPTHGTLTAFSTAGAFNYTPNANYNGADTFQVKVTDSASQTATATITLNVAAVNDPPAANNDVLTVASADALAVLANDTDIDGDALTVTITSAPFVGTATINADKTVKVQLPAGFKGFTKFGYRITDAAGVTSDATALAFVGIQPFKVVALSPAAAGFNEAGIFADDLITRRLVHEPNAAFPQFDINGMVVARSGRAVAYRFNGGNGQEIRYVDLTNPGQSRQVHPPLSGNEQFGGMMITADGRYVIYEFMQGQVPNQKQLNIFDRDAAGPGTRLSLPVADQAIATLGSMDAAGTMMVYPGLTATTQPWISALFRVDFATRTVTRLSPEMAGRHAFVWMTPDAARVVDVRFNAGGDMSAFVTGLSPAASEVLLTEPLTNPKVYFPLMMSPDGSWFIFTEQDSGGMPRRMAIARTASPGSSISIGPAGFTYGDLYNVDGLRADSQSFLIGKSNGGIYTLYEAFAATPSTLVPVISAPSSVNYLNPAYSQDGERVIYATSDSVASTRSLSVTRRGAFGQTTQLTPPSSVLGPYVLDPSGCVALVSLAGTPATLALVNVDAPLALLTLGPSAHQFAVMRVVPR